MCTLDESGEKNISRKSGDTERETSGVWSNVKGPDQDVEL
jgi:hypothetical protein